MMKAIATAALFASVVNAHAIFQEMYVNGVSAGHLTGIRVPDYDGPIMDVTSNDIICNGGINPYHTPLPNTTITVPAGATVTAEWHHDLNGLNPSDNADPIDISHKGPILTYLARIPSGSAVTAPATNLQWFKIYHDGLIPETQTWAVDKLYAAKGKVSFTIPSCIPAGQYLMRNEIIALHSAISYPGAQFYMECAQLTITGGGSTNPPTVSFPGAYKGSDPGITTNIYFPLLTNYTIPGPPVFSCAGSGAGTTSTVRTTSTARTTSVPATTPTSTVRTTSTAAPPTSTGTAAHFAQCGGQGYTGPTVCAAPYTCVVSNQFYSQCL